MSITNEAAVAVAAKGENVAPLETPAPVKERLVFLDGLRGFLALLVAVGHLNFFTGFMTDDNLLALKVRVPAFFALSGFVLYLSSAGRDELEYKYSLSYLVRHRVWRLLPAYYVAIAVVFLVPYLFLGTGLAKSSIVPERHWDAFVWHVFLIHSWSKEEVIRGGVIAPTWMMGYEWQMSLMLPLFLLVVRRIGWAGILLAALLLGVPLVGELSGGFFPASLTFSFLAGMAGARLISRPEPLTFLPRRQWVVLTGGVALVALLALQPLRQWCDGFFPAECAAGLGTAALCAFMTFSPRSPVSRLFAVAPLCAVGTVSYSLFLIHNPILNYASIALGHFHVEGVARRLALFAAVPVIVGATLLLYRFVEKPFVEKLRNEKASRQ